VVAVVAEPDAAAALSAWRAVPGGEQAAAIGRIESGPPDVVLATVLGGERLVEELEDDPLPRIC
jgi:hydrogenase expression/formation protein HypE